MHCISPVNGVWLTHSEGWLPRAGIYHEAQRGVKGHIENIISHDSASVLPCCDDPERLENGGMLDYPGTVLFVQVVDIVKQRDRLWKICDLA